jgi:hypothetical protein
MSLRDEFYGIMVPDFNDKMSELKQVETTIVNLKTDIEGWREMIEAGKKSQVIFQEIAKQTQKNLESHISNLVSLALKAVSPEFPNFIAEMVVRRNQLECDLYFEKYGNKVHPLNSSGGGPKDVASFALLVSYWSMGTNRACLVLDEPFRNVSPDLQGVSHADTVNESADKQFHVNLIGEESHVT